MQEKSSLPSSAKIVPYLEDSQNLILCKGRTPPPTQDNSTLLCLVSPSLLSVLKMMTNKNIASITFNDNVTLCLSRIRRAAFCVSG